MDVTYNFTAGTRAVAEQVNTNFADVKSAVDPLQTDVATIKTQLTSGIILPDGSVDFTRLQSYATYTSNVAGQSGKKGNQIMKKGLAEFIKQSKVEA